MKGLLLTARTDLADEVAATATIKAAFTRTDDVAIVSNETSFTLEAREGQTGSWHSVRRVRWLLCRRSGTFVRSRMWTACFEPDSRCTAKAAGDAGS